MRRHYPPMQKSSAKSHTPCVRLSGGYAETQKGRSVQPSSRQDAVRHRVGRAAGSRRVAGIVRSRAVQRSSGISIEKSAACFLKITRMGRFYTNPCFRMIRFYRDRFVRTGVRLFCDVRKMRLFLAASKKHRRETFSDLKWRHVSVSFPACAWETLEDVKQ